jgi:hypothetical protein
MSRANLLHKHIISLEECPKCHTPSEDHRHLFFTCPASAAVWSQLHINPNPHSLSDIWATTLPSNLPRSVWNSVSLVILWKILDAGNAKVFRDIDQSQATTIRNVVSDFTLVLPF